MIPRRLILAASVAFALPAFAAPLVSTPLVHDKPVEIKADLKGAKELYLMVTDGGDGFVADWGTWIEPTLIKADGSRVKLTELKPKLANVGWGQPNVNLRSDGQPMRIAGKQVAFGFAAHAPSLFAFDLPEGIVGFEARGGIDEGGTSQPGGATVKFLVFNEKPPEQVIAASGSSASAEAKTNDARYGLEKAKANMATFKAAEGLQASLFAAEPMVINPTNIDIDPAGRVWATEAVNYRKWMDLRPEGDRVVILEDSDGDGLADKETTFYQDPKLTNPLGICVLPGIGGEKKGTQVIVSAAPNVWLLTDDNGDDKADRADLLLKVGGNWNHDHQIHAFVFGGDGKLYFNFGNEVAKLMWPDGSTVKDLTGREIAMHGKPYRQGMVFRADLRGGKLENIESLGWNFRNNYEVAVDSFGTMWQSDNDDDGNKAVRINYVMEYGNYGFTDEMTGAGWTAKRTNMEAEIPERHWHLNDPGVVPTLLITGSGSPTGILVNEGSALGAQFMNQMIHCDAGPRIVRAYPVEPDGAGYKATTLDLLTSSDSWYRPSDVAIAPDGSLFVADWYDPGVGGHNMGDREPGKMMGRVYRVSAASGAKVGAPKLDVSTAEAAVTALQSPNHATRYVAWQALHTIGEKAEPALITLAQNQNPRIRARAYGLLAQIPGRETKHLTAALSDQDADIRVLGVRLALMLSTSRDFDTEPLENNRELYGKLMRDPSPHVRRQIAVSLYNAKDIAPLWVALAQQYDGKDRWYLEALGIGAATNEAACFDAWLAAVGEKWDTPAGRDIIWRSRAPKAATYLARILANTPEPEQPRFLRAFDFIPASAEKTQALVTLATSNANTVAREALTRLKSTDAKNDPAVKTALESALQRAKGTAQFVDLVKDFGGTGQGSALLETALALGGDPAGNEAVKLLAADPEADKIINAALAGPKAKAVIDLLGTAATARSIARLTAIAQNAQVRAELREDAVKALARTQPGAEALIKLAQNQQLPPDLSATAGAALRQVEYANLKTTIQQLFPAPSTLGGQPLPAIAELAKMRGDAAKGRAIYERAESSCVMCHKIGDRGSDFGPALTEIGTKLPKEQILDAIINPNTGVTMGFETTQLALKDGTGAMGIVRSETRDEVVLALPGGVANTFRKQDIAKRDKLQTSMMPSGLNQALSQQDLIDLVEYLASLKAATPPPQPPGTPVKE